MIKGFLGPSPNSFPSLDSELEYLREENKRKDIIIINIQNSLNQRLAEVLKLKKIIFNLLDEISMENPNIIKIRNEIIHKLGIPPILNGYHNFTRKSSTDSSRDEKKLEKEEEIKLNKAYKFKPFELSNRIDMVKLMKKKQPNILYIDYKKNNDRSSSLDKIEAKHFLFAKKNIMPYEELLQNLYKFQAEIKENCFAVYKSLKHFSNKDYEFTSDLIYHEINKDMKILAENKYFKTKYEFQKPLLENLFENLIFEILYPKLFQKTEEDIKARNDQLKEKFYVLQNMITFEILDIPQSLRIPSLYTLCQYELQQINDYKTPTSKLDLFSNCAHNLIDVYYKNENRIPNQDELFPLLVYLFLYANPDHFQSNISFIEKYLKKNLLLGEYGFLATCMNAVMLFLDGLDGSALNEGRLEIRASKKATY